MDTEHDPVARAEFVLRRIHPNHIDAQLNPAVQRVAFQPSPKDTDGLSVYRELFVTPQRVAMAGRQGVQYHIARLGVSDLLRIGVSVKPSPRTDELPGHAIIPELTVQNAKHPQSKELQRELAVLASRTIVYPPAVGREEA